VNEMGFKAVYKFSLPAFWYALTAKVYIYNSAPTDTVHGCLRGTAYCFNLWHGIPFKKIEYDIEKGSFYKKFFNPVGIRQKISSFLFEPKIFRNSNGFLATSKKLIPVFASAFKTTEEKIFIGPYPRNELFKLSKNELHDFIHKYESPSFQQLCMGLGAYNAVVIYMPTFRDDNPGFMDNAIPDWEKLNAVCKKTKTLFLIKAHILTKFSTDLSRYDHILMIDSNVDVYPLLPYTHALISDYSSIIFDYSLLNKKIIFYAFDKDEYLSKSRESYFKYEEVFSKDITCNAESLLNEIELLATEGTLARHQYDLSKSFLENNATINDITNHLKKSIKYSD
jgi:CDP-glycerol glycerophosphotransferase (TagB/SpsB family)